MEPFVSADSRTVGRSDKDTARDAGATHDANKCWGWRARRTRQTNRCYVGARSYIPGEIDLVDPGT